MKACKDCPDRALHCHQTCPRYLAETRTRAAQAAANRLAAEYSRYIGTYFRAVHISIQKRQKKHTNTKERDDA